MFDRDGGCFCQLRFESAHSWHDDTIRFFAAPIAQFYEMLQQAALILRCALREAL